MVWPFRKLTFSPLNLEKRKSHKIPDEMAKEKIRRVFRKSEVNEKSKIGASASEKFHVLEVVEI